MLPFLLAATLGAAEPKDRPFYLPSNAKLQFAGNIGLLSLGPGWRFAGEHLDLDLLVGWAPPMDGPESIWTTSLKLTYWPWDLDLGKQWRLRPLSVGALGTFTFGDEYFVTQPDRYPNDYYRFSTAVRFGAFVGASVGRELDLQPIDRADLYLEIGTTDAEALVVFKNLHSLPFTSAFHLALGLAVGF